MANIGHVQYQKGANIGELTAVWVHDDYGYGTGKATGGTNTAFEGCYQIQYFDDKGTLQAELDLEVRKTEYCYNLTWRNKGKITSIGIGLESAGILSVGYHDV